ncbi:MAG TPA: PaaI family thioesterase [Chloroflexi bacterium]|nr:PaaI family thioesterase [Chloroflexota bacterium]
MNDQRIRELLDMFNRRAPIARSFGMRLSFNGEGQAIIDLPYNPDLNHALEGIHGGVYMTLLDSAAWFTAAAAHEESCWLATSELTVHFLKPAKETALRAVGRMIRSGRRQDIVEAHLYDENGEPVGHGIGTFIILPSVPLRPEE